MEGISMKSRYPPSWVSDKEPPMSRSTQSGDRTGHQTSNSYTNDVYSSYPSDCHYMFDRMPNYSSGLNQQIQSGLNQQIPPGLDQHNPSKLDRQFLSELNRNSDKKILQNSPNQNNVKDFSQNQNLVRNGMNQRQHNAIDKSISLDDYRIKRRTEDHQNQFNGGTCKTVSTKLISRDRRRTWSPPLFLESSQLRSTVATKKPVDDRLRGRRYRSNDQINLNSKSQNIETVESFTSPPRIVPISGMLSSSVLNKVIVKPIPFRPTASHYASTTFLQPNEPHFEPRSSSKVVRRAMSMSRLATSSSQDDGYFSHGVLSEDSCTNSRNSTIIASSEQHLNRKQSLSEFDLKNENNLENIAEHDCCESYSDRIYTPFCQSRSSGQSGYTPSPSDSGIGELEALIRERNVELRQLRKTMELNESAMMMVFREKQKDHENDLAKINHDWSLKLEAQEQTSFQTEQNLLLQILKLQSENQSSHEDLVRATDELNRLKLDNCKLQKQLYDSRNRVTELLNEKDKESCSAARIKLGVAKEEVRRQTVELDSLRLQLEDANFELESKNTELHRLLTAEENRQRNKQQLEDNVHQTESNNSQRCSPSSERGDVIPNLKKSKESLSSSNHLPQLEVLEAMLCAAQQERDRALERLEHEREQWLDEKTKVVRYQKHLQLNYTQMARKNKMLESEVLQLTTELESSSEQTSKDQFHMDVSFC